MEEISSEVTVTRAEESQTHRGVAILHRIIGSSLLDRNAEEEGSGPAEYPVIERVWLLRSSRPDLHTLISKN